MEKQEKQINTIYNMPSESFRETFPKEIRFDGGTL